MVEIGILDKIASNIQNEKTHVNETIKERCAVQKISNLSGEVQKKILNARKN